MSSNTSTMLKQAIIDANALREVALKNAESIVVEKYASQIKEAVDNMLEQEEPALADASASPTSGVAEQATYAALDGESLCPCPDEGQTLTIQFDDLQNMLSDMEDEDGDLSGEPMPEPTPAEVLPVEDDEEVDVAALQEDNSDEEIDLSGLLSEEVEELEESSEEPVDEAHCASKRDDEEDKDEEINEEEGPANESQEKASVDESLVKDFHRFKKKTLKENKILTKENNNVSKENKNLIKENKALAKEKEEILKENGKMKDLISELSSTLEESNLSNAKLVYTNQILNSNSLNERQKNRIVEAIGNADSVDAAKSIYETLQSAVGSSLQSDSKPQSLSEAIGRGNTTMLRQKQKERTQDPFMNRMKKLAGI